MNIPCKLLFLAAVLSLVPLAAHAQSGDDRCSDVLRLASHNYLRHYSHEEIASYLSEKACSQSVRADVVGLLFPGFFGSQERVAVQQWCKDNQHLKKDRKTVQLIQDTVVGPSVQAWSKCIDAHKKGLSVGFGGTPWQVTIDMLNTTGHDEHVEGVKVSPDTAGVTCYWKQQLLKADTRVLLPRGRTVRIDCSRAARGHEANPKYRAATISVNNHIHPFTYYFPAHAETRQKPCMERAPERLVETLDGKFKHAVAVWGGGEQSLHCGPKHEAEGFEIIEIDPPNKIVRPEGGGGACAKEPYCDGPGEHCEDFYYSRACKVNSSWLEWYRTTHSPVLKEAICATR